jgi:hypothetical protein
MGTLLAPDAVMSGQSLENIEPDRLVDVSGGARDELIIETFKAMKRRIPAWLRELLSRPGPYEDELIARTRAEMTSK